MDSCLELMETNHLVTRRAGITFAETALTIHF